MLPINLDELSPSHVYGLIESEVAEGLRLEYKQQLPGDDPDGKRKFLYEVAAMANSAGGDIVFGIRDSDGPDGQNTGIAGRLSGIRISNIQKTIEPLSNLIRDCISPRLTGVAMQIVNCSDGDVLVIRIPASWDKPHMVTIGKVDKFYTRTAIGVSPMSVDEIGRSFSEKGDLRDAIERWRARRADLALIEDGPVSLGKTPLVLFHMIPAESFMRGIMRNSWRVSQSEQEKIHVTGGNYHRRYNADGLLCHSQSTSRQSEFSAYTQLFRSGIVEYAFSNISYAPIGSKEPMITGQEIEKEIIRCYKNAFDWFQSQGGEGVVFAGLSLVGVKGMKFLVLRNYFTFDDCRIRQDIFNSPEILVDLSKSDEQSHVRNLLPLIDTMWQVAGREGTPYRDSSGEWNPFEDYSCR
jgi:hypothetical protein